MEENKLIKAREIRSKLSENDIIRAPGVYDGITARLAEDAGFPAVYMTGAGTSLSLGYPDYGLITQTEMITNASIISRTVKVPIIADADTGYGNELNVTRTVREYERADIAAIHIEDQVSPKRCGHLDGKELIPLDQYIAKIRAAAAARNDPNFVIIARTDANTVTGFEDAINRANTALSNGADVAFVEAPKTMDEVAAIPKKVNGPCLLNAVTGGRTPNLSMGDAQEMGYRIAILPSLLTSAIMSACDKALADFKSTDMPPDSSNLPSVGDRFARFDADYWNELRTKFHDT
jgi:2-methylisocitrate lyase-like PEP mutase family enzyme